MMQGRASVTTTKNMNIAIDIEKARFNMVEQQIRTCEVLDQDILDLLSQVKREEFVPAAYRPLAFVDMEIPLAHGAQGAAQQQTMMAPKQEARIMQELAVQKHESVLEIGAGSGYLTALLATCAKKVVSIEIFPEFSQVASRNLQHAGISNTVLKVGDAAQAQPALIGIERYDVIVLTGSTPVLPKGFLDALNPGGRLFAVVGDAPVMKAMLFTKAASASIAAAELFETVLTPLINAQQPQRFEF